MVRRHWLRLLHLGALCVGLAAACRTGSSLSAARPADAGTRAFDAHELEGTWHVVATNFPMWLEGDKTDPTFTYRRRSDCDGVCLDDRVAYTEDGDGETIEGIDRQDPQVPTRFRWRGKGFLRLFASDWEIVAIGSDQSWAVLQFTETWVTPEGMDVIARAPRLTPSQRAEVDHVLASHALLSGKTQGLKWLPAPSEVD